MCAVRNPSSVACELDRQRVVPVSLLDDFHERTEPELHGRAITRDLDWGIPVPVDGWDTKRLYVWFEAVIGYFSASIEWAKNQNTPDEWKKWWYDSGAKTYYFIGEETRREFESKGASGAK